MTGRLFDEILLLLAVAVLAVTVFQRYRLPSSLAYLLVGIVIGPGALNWITDTEDVRLLSEFGIVFLLFTIGLSFPLPDILAMRHLVAGVGTGQVLLSTVLIAVLAWLAGVDAAAAFVIGAAFAQSSTTVISKQLAEQGEDQTRHGRLGTAISIFQDITTVPFVVVIPVLALGAANGAGNGITGPLVAALIKATLAFVIMFVFGRKVLRPLFHAVAARRSSELFTLAVLLVSLAAAWITEYMGLSLALGAFFAGVMLAETEFRHQVEVTIRPFRDVLLGLFFVSIGMLLDVRGLIDLWHWALVLALLLLGVKTLLVMGLARYAGVPLEEAVRTGLLLAVGGEFGFALAAIGLNTNVLTPTQAQVTLTAILISIILAPLLIRYNGAIARRLCRTQKETAEALDTVRLEASPLRDHVVICGYGRIGQNVARFLEQEGIDYVALDLDPARVREAHAAGEPVYYGDSSQREMLESAGLQRARLLVISYDDIGAALKVLHHTRSVHPDLPVLVRTRDDADMDRLQKAGATEVVAETLEAGTMLVSHVLLLLDVPASRVVRRMRDLYRDRYRLLREFYHGEDALFDESEERFRERLHTVALAQEDHAAGRTLADLALDRMGVLVTAIRRRGIRGLAPTPDTRLQAGDVVVLYGAPEDLDRAQVRLRRGEAH